ncbi:MAG: hypothetical protein FJZ01_04160 [Candidatus Sericytochromatia bacterium]|nr:hypothetical protein [Candidatus Tanganyikabacteria bacterium]
MTDTNHNGNPAANLAEMYAEAEKLWTGPIQDFMGSEFFVKWMEVGRDVYLAQTEISRDSLEKYWEAVRLPHKGDIASLAGQVVSIESKVEALEDALEHVADRLALLVGMVENLAPAKPAGKAAKE